MKYKLEVHTIWEQGQRDNQEDWISPENGTANDRLFILCDGMGGHEAGEIASHAVCEAMSHYIMEKYESEDSFSEEDMQLAVDAAFDALDELEIGETPQRHKMGTTMTCLKLHSEGFVIAHIGDSRVYHIRPNEKNGADILFVTRDHSLVNDLIAIGELTEEDAKFSKQKNVITRAMQPQMERRPKPDIYHSKDIKKGDFFFLCSDGMLEEFDNDNIKNVFSLYRSDIRALTEELILHTKENQDNHSAIIIRINEIVTDADDLDYVCEQSFADEVSTTSDEDDIAFRGICARLKQYVKSLMRQMTIH